MKLPYKTTEEVRQTFLKHFLDRDHQMVEQSGIIPKNDPTLMFINSGMAPMKPFFTGKAIPPYPRLTNVQDCIRFVDVESVGDSYHGTNFRMMGSWSFGDYFKDRAIELAFELITEGFGIPAERLSATVFTADESLPGVPSDDESARIWEKFLPRERIIGRPPADNFWGPAGTSGPCGPCTEVFFDRGEEFAERKTDDVLVPGQHIEIWNAGVFMQYFKDEHGNFSPLPMKCVDTGAGLERFAMILQDRASIHQIDQYDSAYLMVLEVMKDIRWSRIVLDHLKTSILMMREGIVPSNTREGYLLRRALRRVMTGVFLRGIGELQVIQQWMTKLAEIMDNRDVSMSHLEQMLGVVSKEQSGFDDLMRRSKKHLNPVISSKQMDGALAFQLKTAWGIPEDFLEEFCLNHGIIFPKDEFRSLIESHREISRRPKKQ